MRTRASVPGSKRQWVERKNGGGIQNRITDALLHHGIHGQPAVGMNALFVITPSCEIKHPTGKNLRENNSSWLQGVPLVQRAPVIEGGPPQR